jgi:hypothetical protein
MTSADVRARKMVLVVTLVAGGVVASISPYHYKTQLNCFLLPSFIVSYRLNRTASSRWAGYPQLVELKINKLEPGWSLCQVDNGLPLVLIS